MSGARLEQLLTMKALTLPGSSNSQTQMKLNIHKVSAVFLLLSVDLTSGLADDARES